MPKMKTHSGAKKRFKVTGSGKVKFKGAHGNHIQAKKNPKRKSRIGGAHFATAADAPRLKRLLVQEGK